ncbi:MAG: zinc-ribbon domain-containing protein, partial [Gammaproteobacteria bacterium]|nr:zinc-ribbon domain-containing protein [Gammaproteobacteria bacterium]
MKTFHCTCGNTLYFPNSLCLACNRAVGYLPDEKQLSAIVPAATGHLLATYNGRQYKKCKNYSDYDVCNWLVPIEDAQDYCVSCRLNQIIPNLNEPKNITLWYRIEQAKRHLLYTLFSLHLPVLNRSEDPVHGMGFEFMEDETAYDEFTNELTTKRSVITGHNAGIITINLLEAQPSKRVKMREE